jgi:3-oxoacyl-[acyl-carrier-protein] synthase-3
VLGIDVAERVLANDNPFRLCWYDRPMDVVLGAFGYYLPATRRTLDELVRNGHTTSDAARLVQLGFDSIHVAGDEPVDVLAAGAVADLVRRSGFDLERVSLMLYGGGLAVSSMVDPGADFGWGRTSNPLPFFKFPGTRLQHELGLPHVPVMGVAQLACNAMQGCIRLARALIVAEPALEHVLCVCADRFPPDANREIVYNLMSDGASAVLVSRGGGRNRILGSTQITRGVYWDGESSHDQLVASYFPLARQVILDGLGQAGLAVAALDLLIPHNINRKSWDILSQVVGISPSKIFTDNIARVGHVVASDNVINYVDAMAAGRVRPGDKVAWFVTGFGAHWSCTVLEA